MTSAKLFPFLNKETGLVELLDPVTGSVVRVQKTKHTILEEKDLVKVVVDGKEIWAESSVNLDKIPGINRWAYSEIIAGLICQRIVEGETLRKICKSPNMPPYSIVCLWRKNNPDFARMLSESKKDWAEAVHDEALEIIDNVAEDQDAINKAKARIDMRKWSMERADPQTFGTKKESGNGGGTVIVINTGILREGDPGFREVTPHGKSEKQIEAVCAHNSSDGSGAVSSGPPGIIDSPDGGSGGDQKGGEPDPGRSSQ